MLIKLIINQIVHSFELSLLTHLLCFSFLRCPLKTLQKCEIALEKLKNDMAVVSYTDTVYVHTAVYGDQHDTVQKKLNKIMIDRQNYHSFGLFSPK